MISKYIVMYQKEKPSPQTQCQACKREKGAITRESPKKEWNKKKTPTPKTSTKSPNHLTHHTNRKTIKERKSNVEQNVPGPNNHVGV